jgi:YD repeat-containing protein
MYPSRLTALPGAPRGWLRAYDPLGRLAAAVDSAGALSRATFDAAGGQAVRTDALRNQTVLLYDTLGRVTQVIEASGSPVQRTTTMIYNAVGDLISKTTGRKYHLRLTAVTANSSVSEEELPSEEKQVNGHLRTQDIFGPALPLQEPPREWPAIDAFDVRGHRDVGPIVPRSIAEIRARPVEPDDRIESPFFGIEHDWSVFAPR